MINRRLIFFFCFFLFLPSNLLFCQDTITPGIFKVDSISISGNDITDDDIILAELGFAPGDKIDSLILEFNRKRIYSLQLFTSVDMILSKKDSLNLLTIAVKESWYIYPIPFIDRNDKDWTKLSFGLDVKVFNFRGRNELLSARGKLGYDPGYSLFYNIPYFFRKEQISFQTDVSYTNRKNKSDFAERLYGEAFKQRVLRAAVTLGKRFSLFNRISLSLGFNYIESPRYIPGVNASNSNIDRYGYISLRYSYDTRNLNIAPTSGLFFNTEYTHKGIGNNEINYGVLSFDLRNYTRLSGIFFGKWRLAMRETIGQNIPYYDISILGVDDRVRGHYNNNIEGNGLITGSFETFFNIFEDIPIEFKLPVIPKSLTRYRVSFGFQFFVDAGVSRPVNGGYQFNTMQQGYGFGITLAVLPYNIARAEVAFDENGKSQLILDIGLSF